jgi:hypothetical protein
VIRGAPRSFTAPESSQLIVRTGFTGGVKASYDPGAVPENAVWEARNLRADYGGALHLRPGSTALGSSLGLGNVQSMIAAFGGLLLAWDGGLYKVNTSTGASTALLQAFMGSSSGPIPLVHWTSGGSEIAYCFAGPGIYQTTGSGVSLVAPYQPGAGEQTNLIDPTKTGTQQTNTGPARCTVATMTASMSQRIAAAGDPQSRNTVYLSAPLNAGYWPANEVLQLPDDGSQITGLYNWYDALLIFRDRDVWAFFGGDASSSSAQLVLQVGAAGCPAGAWQSIQQVPSVGICYLGPDNIYALQAAEYYSSQTRVASVPVGDDVRRFVQVAMAQGVIGACAVYWNEEYRLCIPAAVQPERIFALTLQNGQAWFTDTGPTCSAYCNVGGVLYGGLYGSGQVVTVAQGILTDSGAAITPYVAFRREACQPGPSCITRAIVYVGQQETLQNLQMNLVCDGQSVAEASWTVTAIAGEDFTIGSSVIGVGEIGRSLPAAPYEARLSPAPRGNFAQVILWDSTPGEDVAIVGYALEYTPSDRELGSRVSGR